MRYYMFSMDSEQPEACAREMKARGICAVISPPGVRAAEACRKEGMEVYCTLGAFGMRGEDPDSWLAEDAFGARGKWFGSGCPCEEALFQRNIDAALRSAKEYGARGIFADGLRFASPAPEGAHFLTCFCERCMRAGSTLGFDMPDMRERVRAFAATPDADPPAKWLAFRQARVARAFEAFRAAAAGENLRCGAFVFANSLSPLVGQTENALEGIAILAPMLYRRYRERPGIACLNDEYAALFGIFARRGDAHPAATIERLTGVTVPGDNAGNIWECGFSPDIVERETARARTSFAGTLAPILQMDDERLSESIEAARRGGADAIGFFAYKREWFRRLPELR